MKGIIMICINCVVYFNAGVGAILLEMQFNIAFLHSISICQSVFCSESSQHAPFLA